MGYAVYEDRDAHDRGVERWAGYGVPAICDQPGCDEEIDRGMWFKCGDLGEDNFGEHRGGDCMGCGLYFCRAHAFGDHRGITPKPDTAEWEHHMLTDESWERWRAENPGRTAAMQERAR